MLSLVLENISNDKNTLSTCMRVSSEWNAITAPILYRTVRITYSDSRKRLDPFNLPSVMKDGDTRLSETKIQNVAHIRHLIFHDYGEDGHPRCNGLISDDRYPELSLSSIRLDYNQEEEDDMLAPHWIGGCACCEKIDAEKVVVFDISPILAINPMKTCQKIGLGLQPEP